MGKEPSKKSVATTRKIYAGWQHYDPRQKRYVSVRLVDGGGMRNVDIPVDATKAEIIKQLKAVFPQMAHVYSEKHMKCNLTSEISNVKKLVKRILHYQDTFNETDYPNADSTY